MGSSEYDEKVSSGSKPETGHHVEVSTKEVDTAAALIGDAGEIDPAEAIRIRWVLNLESLLDADTKAAFIERKSTDIYCP